MVNEWPMVSIGEILDFKNGLNKGKSYFGSGTPIINYMDVYHHSALWADDIKGKVSLSPDEIHRFEVKKKDVFFTRTSETPEEVGLSAVLLDDIKDCVFSGFILRGRPKNDWLTGNYCKYCFSTKNVRDEIVRNCTYTTRALTNGRVLSSIEIPLPSQKEQEAIAETLSKFECYINDLAELIEKKKAIRNGALEELMSGRTRLKGFTGIWTHKKISECGKFVSGTGFPIKYQGRKSGEYPFYKVSDLNNNENKNFMCVANNYISSEVAKTLSCKIIPDNAIIFAKIGAAIFLERKRLTTSYCCIDNNMMAFIPNTDISNKFMWFAMQRLQLGSFVQTTALPSLSGTILGQENLFMPIDINEQEAIASVLISMNEELESLEAERDKMIQIREGAMDDLLTGRVRLSV